MNVLDISAGYAGERYDGSRVSAHGISCWFFMHVSLHLFVAYHLRGHSLEQSSAISFW